ncbi:unnamed protein product [Closterium sp. NIES-54]
MTSRFATTVSSPTCLLLSPRPPSSWFEVTPRPAEGGAHNADDTAASRHSPRLETPPGFPTRPSSPPLQPVAVDFAATGRGGARGVGSEGADSGGAGSWGAEPGGAEYGVAELGGVAYGGIKSGEAEREGASTRGTELVVADSGGGGTRAGGAEAAGAGGIGARGAGGSGTRGVGAGGTFTGGSGRTRAGSNGGFGAGGAAQPV